MGQQATSSYLKDLQQSLHVKTADAKGNPEDGWHYNEDQQQGEPHGEGDAQQDAHQVIKRVEEELHRKSQSADEMYQIVEITGLSRCLRRSPPPGPRWPLMLCHKKAFIQIP